jgi:formate-dependent nitrite reductase membrane component NrfD
MNILFRTFPYQYVVIGAGIALNRANNPLGKNFQYFKLVETIGFLNIGVCIPLLAISYLNQSSPITDIIIRRLVKLNMIVFALSGTDFIVGNMLRIIAKLKVSNEDDDLF